MLNGINCARMNLIITSAHNGGGCLNELRLTHTHTHPGMQITTVFAERKQWMNATFLFYSYFPKTNTMPEGDEGLK